MNAPVRLVLDTNTVLAIWMFRDPALQSLERLIAGGTVTLHSREDALEELRRVLAYSQFGVAIEAQAQLLAAYRARVMVLPAAAAVTPGTREAAPQPASIDLPPLLPQCRDRDDQKFLEIAAQAMATHLVTRDKALLKLARHRLVRERFAILTPERFVAAALPDNAALR
ncbi:MAG: putative toxin-antitoxin system toxin component, PIN family [Proteobacteria bacterium]|nr:putative toxin-antitoxin system toxin component, PIN family [Pseudomonadota bacterium]